MSEEQRYFSCETAVLIKWKIRHFFNRTDNGGRLESSKFLLTDTHFSIQVYPNGKRESGWVSLYLRKKSPRSRCHVEVTMGLNKINGSILESRHGSYLFTPNLQIYGWRRLIERSHLMTLDVFGMDESLTVFCEVRTKNDPAVEAELQTLVPDSVETLLQNFGQLYVSGCKTDVVMDVKGKKFSAHTSILSARSSVFRSMFELEMKGKKTCDVDIIDCDPDSFGSFLLFLYNGKLDVVSSSNALALYATADKYNVQDLKEACCECMDRVLCIDSVCDVLRLPNLHHEKELLRSATEYFVKNASKILRTVKWQTFSREDPTLANELYIKAKDEMADF